MMRDFLWPTGGRTDGQADSRSWIVLRFNLLNLTKHMIVWYLKYRCACGKNLLNWRWIGIEHPMGWAINEQDTDTNISYRMLTRWWTDFLWYHHCWKIPVNMEIKGTVAKGTCRYFPMVSDLFAIRSNHIIWDGLIAIKVNQNIMISLSVALYPIQSPKTLIVLPACKGQRVCSGLVSCAAEA